MTAVTTLLTSELGSAGMDKLRAFLAGNPKYDFTADEWNNLKRAAVELTSGVGLSDATTAASIMEALSRGMHDAAAASRFIYRDDFIPGEGPAWLEETTTISGSNVPAGADGGGFGRYEALEIAIGVDEYEQTPEICVATAVRVLRCRSAFGDGDNTIGLMEYKGHGFYCTFGSTNSGGVLSLFCASVSGGNTIEITSNIAPDIARADEFRAEFNGAGTVSFYLNELLIGTETDALGIPDATEPLGFGRWANGYAGPGESFLPGVIRCDYLEVEGVRL